jgi:transcriptional regulator with XRE-family HTH domain
MLGKMPITPGQCKAARGLIDMDQAELAVLSSISRNTIVDFEKAKRTPGTNNLAAIQRALEAAGVEFTNGGEPGVKLRKVVKGDRVRIKAGSALLIELKLAGDEVGVVSAVENDPARHSGYRISVRFNETIVRGDSSNFEIAR